VNLGAGIRVDANGHIAARSLGDGRRSTDKVVRTYTTGRRCPCGVRLSIYNADDVCATCTTERWADHS
jgi:hypothetical protein